jgi:YidC/Oxa1 family membrane protein insertase
MIVAHISRRCYPYQILHETKSTLQLRRGILTESVQNILITVNDWSGTPWWATITSSSIALRVMLLPTFTRASYVASSRLRGSAPDIQLLGDLMRKKILFLRGKDSVKGIVLQDFLSPEAVPVLKSYTKGVKASLAFREIPILPIVAYPVVNGASWILFVWSIRQMLFREDVSASLSNGGMLWFTDLTAADPLFILPISAVLLTSVHLHTSTVHSIGLLHRRIKNFLQVGMILFAPWLMFADAGIFFYWIPGTIFKMLESRLLSFPKFRRMLGIPDASDSSLLRGEALLLRNNGEKRYGNNNTDIDSDRARSVK